MTAERFEELERAVELLKRRLADVDLKAQQAGQSVAQVWAAPWGGGGSSSSGGAFYCNSIPALAGGATGTGDVYQRNGGSNVLFATGATIYNPYASATTAGRVCTLGLNPDGTFTIYAQSCT